MVAKLQADTEVIVRRYKQLSATDPMREYELIAENQNWASIRVSSKKDQHKIIGVVLAFIRLI